MKTISSIKEKMVWIPYLVIALFCIQVVVWASDRKSPFEVITSSHKLVKPGKVLELSMVVRRDVSRGCSLNLVRWLESHGRRTEAFAVPFDAQDLTNLQKELPNRLELFIFVPDWFPVGLAVYRASLAYQCNPLHHIWPIMYQQIVPFEVSPN